MPWILFLSVVGMILICLEVFLPGMVAGILGVLLLVGAVILTYMEYGSVAGNKVLLGLIVGSGAILALWITFFPRTRAGQRMVMRYDLAESTSTESRKWLLGKTGTSLSPLRPAGVANIEERRVDVVAESGWIEHNAPIQVVSVEGSRVVVRKS